MAFTIHTDVRPYMEINREHGFLPNGDEFEYLVHDSTQANEFIVIFSLTTKNGTEDCRIKKSLFLEFLDGFISTYRGYLKEKVT